jgi:hypothetical protein
MKMSDTTTKHLNGEIMNQLAFKPLYAIIK